MAGVAECFNLGHDCATEAAESDISKAAGGDMADRWRQRARRSGSKVVVRYTIGRKPNREDR